jgi:hypothetical protein
VTWHPRWTAEQEALLYALAEQGHSSFTMSPLIGKSAETIRQKAMRVGLSLNHCKWAPTPSHPDKAKWTDADRIAMWAWVRPELASLVVEGARKFNVSVKWLRSESRMEELIACRHWIATEARRRGFSYPQIGRALNRDHTTIMHTVKSSPRSTEPGRFAACVEGPVPDRIAA